MFHIILRTIQSREITPGHAKWCKMYECRQQYEIFASSQDKAIYRDPLYFAGLTETLDLLLTFYGQDKVLFCI